MRVLLSTIGSRGDVEPLVGLAVQVRALGAEVRVCAPPDFAERLAEVGVPFVPLGPLLKPLMHGAAAPSADGLPLALADLIATQFDTIIAAAHDCDALVAAGFMPIAGRSVTEQLGIGYFYASYQSISLPSPHHPPPPFPGQSFPPDVTDNRVLWDLDTQGTHALLGPPLNDYRATVGLPPVENVRSHIITGRPLLAADPTLDPWQPADLDVVQTGAWIGPDERQLPAEVEAFLQAGPAPVYVSFGSMRAPADAAQVAIAAARAQGCRVIVGRGWADLSLIDDREDCLAVDEVNQQALFRRVAAVVHHGGAGTTTVAALAGAPQVVVPQAADQPYWASRVAALGIGVAHDDPAPTIESLSVALKSALAAPTRARAAEMAGAVRTDGAAVAAALLVDAIGEVAPPA
jgi:vancomycin aglycone glucosyltransferase